MQKKLKFLAVLSLVMVMAAGSAFAQFKFGVKASATLNNILIDANDWGPDYNSSDHRNPLKPGFNIGVMAEYAVSERKGIVFELLYAQQGRKDVWEPVNGESYTNRTSYNINLPILYRFYFGKGLAFEVGPQIGFCFGGNDETYTRIGSVETTTTKTWAKEEEELQQFMDSYKGWKRVNLGVSIGANYNFDFGLFVGARYTIGLTNYLNGMEIDSELRVKQTTLLSRNSCIALNVGYRF